MNCDKMILQPNSCHMYLNNIWQSKEEGHDANDEHQELVVDQLLLDPIREPILNGGNNDFHDRKLKSN